MSRPTRTDLFNSVLEGMEFVLKDTSELAKKLGSYENLIKYYADGDGIEFRDAEDFAKFCRTVKEDYPTIADFTAAMPLAIMDTSGGCKGIGNYTAGEIAEVLDVWFKDYVSSDLVNELEGCGIRLFKVYPTLAELGEIGENFKESKNENEREFYANHDWDFDLVELLLDECEGVDLGKVVSWDSD